MRKPYTPSTEDVREAYADWNSTDVFGAPGIPTPESRENFDRWLNQQRAQVLREAADDLDARGHAAPAVLRLRDRAHRIEMGDDG